MQPYPHAWRQRNIERVFLMGWGRTFMIEMTHGAEAEQSLKGHKLVRPQNALSRHLCEQSSAAASGLGTWRACTRLMRWLFGAAGCLPGCSHRMWSPRADLSAQLRAQLRHNGEHHLC